MTLMERSPNLIFATRLVGKFFAKQETYIDDPVDEVDVSGIVGDVNDDVPAEDVDTLRNFGDHASAYRLTQLIAATDAAGAKIIGIVGARRGAGSSVTSRQIAGAFASFGRKVLLVDSSTLLNTSDAQPHEATDSLLELAEEVRPSLSCIDLASAIGDASVAPEDFAAGLKSAAESGQTIIVDLPPIVDDDGHPNMAIRDLGAACDLVFLVCLTGELRRKELSACVETCRIIGIELNGLVLNDWQLPASQLLES